MQILQLSHIILEMRTVSSCGDIISIVHGCKYEIFNVYILRTRAMQHAGTWHNIIMAIK